MSENYEGQGMEDLINIAREHRAALANDVDDIETGPPAPKTIKGAGRFLEGLRERAAKHLVEKDYFMHGDIVDDKAVVCSLPHGSGIGAPKGIEYLPEPGEIFQLPSGGLARLADRNDAVKPEAKLVIIGTGATDAHLIAQARMQIHAKGAKMLLVQPPAGHEESVIRQKSEDEQKAWAAEERAKLVAEHGEALVAKLEAEIAADAAAEKQAREILAPITERVVERSHDKRLRRQARVALRLQKGKAPKF